MVISTELDKHNLSHKVNFSSDLSSNSDIKTLSCGPEHSFLIHKLKPIAACYAEVTSFKMSLFVSNFN